MQTTFHIIQALTNCICAVLVVWILVRDHQKKYTRIRWRALVACWGVMVASLGAWALIAHF